MKNRFSGYILISIITFVMVGCTVPRPAPVETRTVEIERKPVEAQFKRNKNLVDGAFYTVRKGDTLYGIALAFGQNWRDIASWNNLTDPDKIKVGEKLRVVPKDVGNAAVSIPLKSAAIETPSGKLEETGNERALDDASPDDNIYRDEGLVASLGWVWPANGQITEQFSDSNSKGISIAGAAGEAIFAVSDGKVVYSGNGLRGYGNLVIIKHPDEFITAYAHNKSIFVKEGEAVNKGQKIAEMGMSETDSPKLLFEVRRGGKPLDPLLYLPNR
ncbi:MAG: peptidase M23 [Proteobacteria bacterium]|nr:peptidase M23 [Pseudomonadota bacterium]|tara:strand:- start:400 stop:1218 length:819 start_codon:yes stop_codon:yes gene_type:complete